GWPSRRYPSPISSSTWRRRRTFGDVLKNVSASRTVMSRTWSTLRPRYFTSSTCGLKRLPSQTSHGTNTSARNCISTLTSPSPSHAAQRPPGTLNEKWLAVRPRDLASLVDANSSRIGSKALRYVTGFDRGVRPIGCWSTRTASVMNSTPSSFLNVPTRLSHPPFARLIAAYNTSCTSVDFPDPLTPVTTVNVFNGMLMSTSLRLCSLAPTI